MQTFTGFDYKKILLRADSLSDAFNAAQTYLDVKSYLSFSGRRKQHFNDNGKCRIMLFGAFFEQVLATYTISLVGDSIYQLEFARINNYDEHQDFVRYRSELEFKYHSPPDENGVYCLESLKPPKKKINLYF